MCDKAKVEALIVQYVIRERGGENAAVPESQYSVELAWRFCWTMIFSLSFAITLFYVNIEVACHLPD